MNESNSVETIDRTNLTDRTKFKLNEISKIENYLNQEKNVIGAPIVITSASFTLGFSLTTGIIEKLQEPKRKTAQMLVLAKSKLNSIETLVSQVLIDMEISHEEFITILNEKNKYEKMKEDIRTMTSSDEGKKIKQQNCKWK